MALAQSRDILRRAQQLGDAMQPFSKTGRKVTLRIGFIPTALPGLLAEGLKHFNQTEPNVCIQILEMHPSEQITALRSGDIQLALPGAASAKVKAEFFTQSLRTTPLAVVVPQDHPLAHMRRVELREFAIDRFLSLDEARFPGRENMHQRLFKIAGIAPTVTLHASGLNELLGLVGSGAGVALAPADMKLMRPSGLKFLRLTRPTMTFNFSAVWRDCDPLTEIEKLVNVLARIEQQ